MKIINFAFQPGLITVSAGSKVVWWNSSTSLHTVTSTSGPASFNSGDIAKQWGSYEHTFNVAGVYQYRCNIHRGMTGTITVN